MFITLISMVSDTKYVCRISLWRCFFSSHLFSFLHFWCMCVCHDCSCAGREIQDLIRWCRLINSSFARTYIFLNEEITAFALRDFDVSK